MAAFATLPSLPLLLKSCGVKEEVYVPKNITIIQYETIWHIAENILPKTITPGASDAKVAQYFDSLFSGYLNSEAAEELLAGLDKFINKSQQDLKQEFAKVPVDTQVTYLQDLSEIMEPNSFYTSVKGIILWAFFTSEVGIKSMNYRPVPGRYNGCVTTDESTKNIINNRW